MRGPYQWLWERLPRRLRDRAEIEPASIRRFVERAAVETAAGSRVLDAGAGDCRYRPLFGHCRYVAVDSCKVEKAYAGIDVVGRLEEIPLASGCFDAVLCAQVLEHVPDPPAALGEIHRVLRRAGALWLSVPLFNEEHEAPQDFFRYTRFGLARLLERAGFEVVTLEPRGGYFWQLGWQLRRLPSHLFPPTRNPLLRLLRAPLAFVFWCAFGILVPLVLYPLDRLDSARSATLGFTCEARRSGSPPSPRRWCLARSTARDEGVIGVQAAEPAAALGGEQER